VQDRVLSQADPDGSSSYNNLGATSHALAGRGCTFLHLPGDRHTLRKSFGMYGGDDGARTRDLCRDSECETRNPK
jgi:hypothetical protein